MIDSISQLVSTIKNGYLVRKNEVELPHSKYKESILRVLEKENFLAKVSVRGEKPKQFLRCTLRYEKGKPALEQIKLISKPGLRVYERTKSGKKVIGGKKVLAGLGVRIISTPKGVMTDKQAIKEKVGGEVILEVF